ncbi:unnamed protein product [Clonostachys solani]|uniref:Uncharacterized protein n=1 Tax=Clonostachys solani TaxID=160281 RepID=A0A9N9ZK19_9HYPO|nr:unnamed protein product [Clonostachys solani]
MAVKKRKRSLHSASGPYHLQVSSQSFGGEIDSESCKEKITPALRNRSSHVQQLAKQDELGEEHINDSEEGKQDDEDDEYSLADDSEDSEQEQTQRDQSHSEQSEDEPSGVVIIPLEQVRDEGNIEYVDFRLHPNSLLFLVDLKSNNNRRWLKEFRRAFRDWETFVERTTYTIMALDDTIPELPARDVMFRIYRDLRFSPDKKPYKAHFSAAWSRTGRKGTYAHYYIHCEPGASLIAGGIFAPDTRQLQRLRASIDERPRRWRRVLNEYTLKEAFLPGLAPGSGEGEALKSFARENKDSALRTKPKAGSGFNTNHQDIELLKLKKFTVSKRIEDNLLCADDTQERVKETLRPLVNFITFLNSIVMPDDDSSNSSE